MRKCLVALLLAVFALTAAACGSGGGTSTETSGGTAASTGGGPDVSSMLKQAGTLKVGAELPAPPFLIPPRDNPTGFEADVANELAKRLGNLKVEWLNVPFTSLFSPAPKPFDFDINEITITPERDKVVDFSDSYFDANQALLVHKGTDAENATTMDAVKKLLLGAQATTTGLDYIKNTIKPDKKAREFDTTTAANQALLNKQIDAFIIDVPIAAGLVQQNPNDLTIVGQFVTNEQYGILFEDGNPLREAVNTALAAMKSDGTLKKLQDKWFPAASNVPTIQ